MNKGFKTNRNISFVLFLIILNKFWPQIIRKKKSLVKKKFVFFSFYNSFKKSWYAIREAVIFWPSPRPKNAIPRWYTGRKWHIPMASNRKRSHGRIKAYDMGQGEGLIVPLTVMHRKRGTSELHDSYFHLITIKHSISKIQWAIVWALNYYIIELSWVPRQLLADFQRVRDEMW